MLTHAQLTECSKIYAEFAEKYGKLPKQFKETADDFCKVFAEYLPDAVSVQIRQWFRAYLVDYLPILEIKHEKECKKEQKEPKEVINKQETQNAPENTKEKAQILRAEGKSYVQIAKILGVSDKTAKKLCEM